MRESNDRCPQELAPLLSVLLDGELGRESHAALQDLISQNTDCRRYYLRFMRTHGMLQWALSQDRPHRRGINLEYGHDEWRAIGPDSFLAALELLDDPSSEIQLVHIDQQAPSASRKHVEPKASITTKEFLSATSYLINHTLATKAAVISAIAAVLVIGTVLMLVYALPGDTPQTGPSLANKDTPAEPQPRPAPSNTSSIATLSGEVNARWRASSGTILPAVGNAIYAGESFTLIDGFAEITTNDGAVVTIEAPATVQFIDHDNAIHLHAGKLIGICETKSSKGLIVRTPQAEITDLGTVFVVESDDQGRTTAGVIRGRIAIAIAGNAAERKVLETGQLARVSNDNRITTELDPAILQHFRSLEQVRRPVRVSGEAVLVDHMPRVLGVDDQFVRVFREATSVLIDEPLTVSRVQTGLYMPKAAQTATLDAGVRVDSYLVHYDRIKRAYERGEKRFTITFEQPVVAMILSRELLIDTDAMFGVKGVSYKGGPRGVENETTGIAEDQVDSIELSEDRKTLRITLIATDYDQIRVLTQSPQAASAE